MSDINTTTNTTQTHAAEEAEHICNTCLKVRAITQLLDARSAGTELSQDTLRDFAMAFNYCVCHALKRFEEALGNANEKLSDTVLLTREQFIDKIIAELDEMSVRDDASAAFTQFLAEPYQFDMEDGEDNGGAAAAIEYSREAEPRLAKHFNLTVERVREIIAAADVSQDKHGYDYECLLDDILLRLKNNNAGDCDEETKASALEDLAHNEVMYIDSAFMNFITAVRNLNDAQREKARAALNADLNRQMEDYRKRLTMTHEERLAQAAQDIAKEEFLREYTPETLVEYRMKHIPSDPTKWHTQQGKQLEVLLNGGDFSVKARLLLGFSVYRAIAAAAA